MYTQAIDVPQPPEGKGNDAAQARAGASPAFLQASMYLALVPKILTRSRCARSHSTSGLAWNGEPSNRTKVSSTASPPTSQFHIIQPQVV